MAKIRTHYDNLKVARNAPESVIKAAYKALCQTYHPDKFQGSKEEAERIIKLIKASYVVLLDPDKRVNHDRWINEQEAKAKQQSEKSEFHDFDEPTEQRYQHKHDNPETEESTQSTYSNPNSTPPPNTNAESQSTPRTSGWLRFFARIFDMWWETLIVTFLLAFLIARYSEGFVEWLNNKPYADKTFGFLCIPVALVLDAILYSVFGNTPGKALIGFKIKNAEGQALGFSQYLGRNLKVYVRGFGLGLPIVNFITMYNQSIRLRKGQQASYDEATGFRVYKQPVGWIRKTLFGCAFLLLFTVMSMLNLIEKFSNPEPTTITNQEISTNTTPQPVYQVNITNDNLQRANNLFIQNRFAEALPLYQNLAQQNNAQAQTILGYMHETGKGVQVDYSQSIYLFRKAAGQGDSEAQYRLGSMYKTGRGIAQDNDQAVYWYQKAAQQGSASAQVSLGWHYMNGLGNLPKDYKQAAYWNELGSQNGDSEGANNLGWLYEHGLGVAQDLTKAAELYQKAINRGIEIGVEKERIDEAKSRLAGLTKLRQLNKPSDKKVVVTETNDTLQVNIDDEKKFEIRGNLPRLKKEMSESRLSPVHKYESNNGEKVIKQECIIKPVMTKAELSNCQN